MVDWAHNLRMTDAAWSALLPLRSNFTQLGADYSETSIPARFEAQVLRFGERVAVKSISSAMTYSQLDAEANRVARLVRGRCGESRGPVALLMDKDALHFADLG